MPRVPNRELSVDFVSSWTYLPGAGLDELFVCSLKSTRRNGVAEVGGKESSSPQFIVFLRNR